VKTRERGISRRELYAHRHRTTTVVVLLALCTFIGTRSILSIEREEKQRRNMHVATTSMKPKPLVAEAATTTLWMPARYTLDDDLPNRSARFPSIEERVRVYTSDWYAPPCSNDQKLRYSYSHVPVAWTSTSTSTSTPTTAATPCTTRMSANNNNSTGNNTSTLTNNPNTKIESSWWSSFTVTATEMRRLRQQQRRRYTFQARLRPTSSLF
jgi:hypothetical protein